MDGNEALVAYRTNEGKLRHNMSSTIQKLCDKGLIKPPSWLSSNVMFETIMGSVAYGVSSDTSDMDLYGYCMPSKFLVFPHLAGEIPGFGTELKRFEQFQIHHVNCPDEMGGKGRVYDIQVYSIIKYFQLCMGCNPNMVDSLFTPLECILFQTQGVGAMVRENRKMFLHQGAWHTFKGYAYSQLHMTDTKRKDEHFQKVTEIEKQYGIPHSIGFDKVEEEVARRDMNMDGDDTMFSKMTTPDFIEYYRHYRAGMEKTTRFQALKAAGTDLKFLYHVVRLLYECEMIMTEGDLDLRRNKEHLKAIRRGDVPETDIRQWAADKEKQLEGWYGSPKCAVPFKRREPEIKQLLMDCLEHHYGDLSACVVREDVMLRAFREVANVVDRHRNLLG